MHVAGAALLPGAEYGHRHDCQQRRGLCHHLGEPQHQREGRYEDDAAAHPGQRRDEAAGNAQRNRDDGGGHEGATTSSTAAATSSTASAREIATAEIRARTRTPMVTPSSAGIPTNRAASQSTLPSTP